MAELPVIIIGAGIVGISTALWLRRAGKSVCVLDRGEVGMGASYGNAGLLAACAMVPVTTPGLGAKGPLLLLNRNFPLFLRWPYLPKLAPWLRQYLTHANDSDTRRIASGLADITTDSVAQHDALAGSTTAQKWLTHSDYAFAYKDRTAFQTDSYAWQLREAAGFTPQLIEGRAAREYEPLLAPATSLLAVVKGHGYVQDPARYVQALAAVLKAEGGEIRQAEVVDIELSEGRVRAVITDQGPMPCAAAVLTTGAWSKPLMQKLGLNIPLETERGYHLLFKNPSQMPRQPLMISAGKFVATPMAEGLRCAGVVEFGGLKAGPSKPPLAFLHRKVKESFPTLKYAGVEEWMGHRPTLADSLPMIGEIRNSSVFAGFGHHHIGLTAGPKTGRILADMITQKRPNADFSAYDPMRFG